METYDDKQVLILGDDASTEAAQSLLEGVGAHVVHFKGIESDRLSGQKVDKVIISSEIFTKLPILKEIEEKKIPIISELELGYQHSLCLSLAVTGTNGKTTTTDLIGEMLNHCGRKTIVAGHLHRPMCSVVKESKELDFLTLEISAFQLERVEFFRPTVAVLMNITPDHLDRYGSMPGYVKLKARIFEQQQIFDWAVIQSEALALLRTQNVNIPSKIITFSSANRNADVFLDRGLIVSRMPDWSGPLLDMAECKLRGPHNAENIMAALIVGRILKLPLEHTLPVVREYQSPPHRCELVAEKDGVQYINDAKSTNVDSLNRALTAIPQASGGMPNVWLISGGRDKGFDYHDIGPLLSHRVKGAFLIGEAREKIRAAWSLFTPCVLANSLLEALSDAVKNAVPGDVILFSPACSSFDQFRNYQHRGEVFRQGVARLTGKGLEAGKEPAAGTEEDAA